MLKNHAPTPFLLPRSEFGDTRGVLCVCACVPGGNDRRRTHESLVLHSTTVVLEGPKTREMARAECGIFPTLFFYFFYFFITLNSNVTLSLCL